MAQVTTGELSGMVTIIMGVGFAALGYFVKRLIDGIDTKLSDICANQNRCQRELPEKYVLKHDCEKDMGIHSASIIKVAGKLNGGSLHHDPGH